MSETKKVSGPIESSKVAAPAPPATQSAPAQVVPEPVKPVKELRADVPPVQALGVAIARAVVAHERANPRGPRSNARVTNVTWQRMVQLSETLLLMSGDDAAGVLGIEM